MRGKFINIGMNCHFIYLVEQLEKFEIVEKLFCKWAVRQKEGN